MLATQLSSKGQVVLPKPIREQHNWQAGQKFSIEATENGIFLRAENDDFAPTTLDDVAGCLNHTGPALSIEQMDDAITATLKTQHARR